MPLRRVTMTRNEEGSWDVLRERDDSGERFMGCDDLIACFDVVRSAYFADGSPRPLDTSGTEGETK